MAHVSTRNERGARGLRSHAGVFAALDPRWHPFARRPDRSRFAVSGAGDVRIERRRQYLLSDSRGGWPGGDRLSGLAGRHEGVWRSLQRAVLRRHVSWPPAAYCDAAAAGPRRAERANARGAGAGRRNDRTAPGAGTRNSDRLVATGIPAGGACARHCVAGGCARLAAAEPPVGQSRRACRERSDAARYGGPAERSRAAGRFDQSVHWPYAVDAVVAQAIFQRRRASVEDAACDHSGRVGAGAARYRRR